MAEYQRKAHVVEATERADWHGWWHLKFRHDGADQYLSPEDFAKDYEPVSAPAPGAEAAIEALGLSYLVELRIAKTTVGDYWRVILVNRAASAAIAKADGPTLSAALAALRGEAKS